MFTLLIGQLPYSYDCETLREAKGRLQEIGSHTFQSVKEAEGWQKWNRTVLSSKSAQRPTGYGSNLKPVKFTPEQ